MVKDFDTKLKRITSSLILISAGGLEAEAVRDQFLQIADVLGLGKQPLGYSPEELVPFYQMIHSGAAEYTCSPTTERGVRGLGLIDALDNVEFEASWAVLRRGLSDDKINDLTAEQRTACYLSELYVKPLDFIFFKPREDAINSLAQLNLIKLIDYKLK